MAKDGIPGTASQLIIYKTIINLFRAMQPTATIWAAIKAEGISQPLTVGRLTCIYVERSGTVARAQALNTGLERIKVAERGWCRESLFHFLEYL